MRKFAIRFNLLTGCRELHNIIVNDGVVKGAIHFMRKYGNRPKDAPSTFTMTEEIATKILQKGVRKMLLQDQFEAAAALLWGDDVFDPTPQSTQDVFYCLWTYPLNMVMGAGSMGKSYSGGAWFFLDYYRDPEWTSLKVLSSTRKHAKTNIYAHMQHLSRSACFDLGLTVLAESIRINDDERHGISLDTIPQGDEGKGRLRGFHPIPRTHGPHEVFGLMSRVYVLLDEAEEIPGGVWDDIDNLMLSESSDSPGHVKLFAASNPKDRGSKYGQRCEPANGWSTVSIDESRQWEGKLGWHVLRLDGATCENVQQKQVVYPGMQTYDGYMRYATQGGDTTPQYFTMARGWFPEQGLAVVAIPEDVVRNAIGTFHFTGPVRHMVAHDLAFEGEDLVRTTVGRIGDSDGWVDANGKRWYFKDRSRDNLDDLDDPTPGSMSPTGIVRRVVQLEQQITMPKERTLELTRSIIRMCKQLHVTPMMTIVDRTGNGTGVYHNLLSMFGDGVVGVHYGEAATDMPLFRDEPEIASELYDGIVTELVFGLGRYMEFHYLKLSPAYRHDQLIAECSKRRYKQKGTKLRIESKKEYVQRTQEGSPDSMDSASMLVLLARMRGDMAAAMLPEARRPEQSEKELLKFSVVDETEFIDFSV
jgi:hypothetical protein